MSVNVADLVATLRVDASGIDKGLAQMQQRLGKVEQEVKQSGRATAELTDTLDRAGQGAARIASGFSIAARVIGVAVTGLSGGIAGIATGLTVHLLEAWRKNTEEAKKFQDAINSVNIGKLETEIDRLMTKLNDAATSLRSLREPLQSFGELGPDPLAAFRTIQRRRATTSRDTALDDIAKAREQVRAAQQGESEVAGMKELDKLLKQNLINDFKALEAGEEEARKSWTAYAQQVIDDLEREQIAMVKLQDEMKKQEDMLTASGIAAWVAHADAVIAETEREQLAIVKQQDEAFQDEERFRQEDIKGWVAHAEAVIAETEREQQAQVDLQDQRLANQQKFVDSFQDINTALASTANAITQNTTSIEQAFAQMGRSIAASLIENVVKKGLEVVEKALFDFLEELQRNGMTRQLIGAAANALVGIFSSSSTTNTGTGFTADTQTTGGLPASAEGGVFSGAQARIIGEAGPEAVIPLKGGAVPVMLNGGGTVVNVYNQAPGTTAETQERTGSAGQRIYDIVIKTVKSAATNGDLDSVMAQYGARRQGVSR